MCSAEQLSMHTSEYSNKFDARYFSVCQTKQKKTKMNT